jgi:hypothetical protein
MSNELSIPIETRVALDVSEANRLHRYAQAQAEMAACAGRNAVTAGLKLGKLLVELKAATAHGEWGGLFGEASPNVTHGLHFNFTRKTANQYMRCYKTAAGRLANVERYLLDAGLSGEPVNDLAALVDKTTDGAETPRQMMLNLGVIATRKRATHDRVKPLGFADSGNPDGAQALTPMDKLANDLAAISLSDEELERRQHQAEQDAAYLLKQLGTFVDQGYIHLLRLQERELFAESLAAYARKVSDADEQSIKATMEGLVNGTTTL